MTLPFNNRGRKDTTFGVDNFRLKEGRDVERVVGRRVVCGDLYCHGVRPPLYYQGYFVNAEKAMRPARGTVRGEAPVDEYAAERGASVAERGPSGAFGGECRAESGEKVHLALASGEPDGRSL